MKPEDPLMIARATIRAQDREAKALRTALAAADRLAEACAKSDGVFFECAVCGGIGPAPEESPPEHRWNCPVAAYLAARKETTNG